MWETLIKQKWNRLRNGSKIDLGALCELDDAVISYKREAVTDTIDRFRAVPKILQFRLRKSLPMSGKTLLFARITFRSRGAIQHKAI